MVAQPADSPSGAVMSLTNAPQAVPPDATERRAVHPVDEVLPVPDDGAEYDVNQA